jgi:hypothetical protein
MLAEAGCDAVMDEAVRDIEVPDVNLVECTPILEQNLARSA